MVRRALVLPITLVFLWFGHPIVKGRVGPALRLVGLELALG
jgi:hypothetical protein